MASHGQPKDAPVQPYACIAQALQTRERVLDRSMHLHNICFRECNIHIYISADPWKGFERRVWVFGSPSCILPQNRKITKTPSSPPVPFLPGPLFAVKMVLGRRPQREVAVDKLFERPQNSFDISTNSKNLQFSSEGRSKSAVADWAYFWISFEFHLHFFLLWNGLWHAFRPPKSMQNRFKMALTRSRALKKHPRPTLELSRAVQKLSIAPQEGSQKASWRLQSGS